MDIRAGSSGELQGPGISCGREWGITWRLSEAGRGHRGQGGDTGGKKGFPWGGAFILHQDGMRTRTFHPFPQLQAELRANPPPAGVEPTQGEVAAVSQGSYSRCWGVRAAAGPRSPSSRSFCRSGEQNPHRACVTLCCQAWQSLCPLCSPPCRDPPKTPRIFPCLSQSPLPSQIHEGPPGCGSDAHCQPHTHPGLEGQGRRNTTSSPFPLLGAPPSLPSPSPASLTVFFRILAA